MIQQQQHTTVPPEVHRALAYVGIFARVATQEGLSTSHVALTAHGKRTSRRVIAAIVREVRRIERKSASAAQHEEKAA